MLGLSTIARKIFGTQNERELKSIAPLVQRINEFEPSMKKLTQAELQGKTAEFRSRLDRGEPLDALLPEAFAVTREAAWRVIGQRHYDVQMIGGITLHRGRIAEMKTGEGKTLVATLPCYLNALPGKGVHVITVNDYLARRDSQWMGQIYNFLGLKVGIIVHGLTDVERKTNYGADITYGTNNEFGFDYLRDNMKFRIEDYVQRDLNYAIIDEVDSILIDEARTPLIISGPTDQSTDLYYKIDQKIREGGGLTPEMDYTVDEKSKTAALTEAGVAKMEGRLGVPNLYDPTHIEILHHVNQSLRAHVLYKLDVEYVIRDDQIIIVDEFTGRLMPGRRWSDGLHQAIEAKEGVKIENENQTLATITFQNYFRMYKKLSGMTGTADTEATEFKQIYGLDVTVIPTNRPMVRKDEADVIFKSEESKLKAICEELKTLNEKGQPVLVGTISVEKSEKLSHRLKSLGIKHNVLNAKQHAREADVVAQAGRKHTLTIATNMAGRGTDIMLGGDAGKLALAEAGAAPPPSATDEERKAYETALSEATAKWKARCEEERKEVLGLGGLFILGTERHESRRIDNQLRGRSGRQGDPGQSRFYLSLDDDLMRIFGGERIKKFMEDDVPIEHKWITKSIANAQTKVEGHNYDIRKHLLEYDDVNNEQRKVIYGWRREVLANESVREMTLSMIDEITDAIVEDFFPNGKLPKKDGVPHLDFHELNAALKVTFQIPDNLSEKDIDPMSAAGLKKAILDRALALFNAKVAQFGEEFFSHVEKVILLSTIDTLWKDHLLAMDHLREGIGLQGYGQKDPLIEFKKEGFRFFEMMMRQITGDVVRKLFTVHSTAPGESDEVLDEIPRRHLVRMQYNVSSDGNLIPQKQPDPRAAMLAGNPPNPAEEIDPELLGGVPQGLDPAMAGYGQMPMRSAPGFGKSSVGTRQFKTVESNTSKVGRNDPCPCGSGKKFKKCHGQNA